MNHFHRAGSNKKFKDIFEGIRAKHEKEIERQEAWIKKFMAERGLTLFDLLVDYEFQQKPMYLETIDDFDIKNLKVNIVHEYGFHKRTPEERAEFPEELEGSGMSHVYS